MLVSDFHQDGDEATIRLHEKGDKRRTIGLHYAAAQAINEYLAHAGITSGPLFRPWLNPRSVKLADRPMNPATMYHVIQSYLERIPGAIKEMSAPDATVWKQCIFTPHSLRPTTATLLLDLGGHLKTGHAWSLQNRPYEMARDVILFYPAFS